MQKGRGREGCTSQSWRARGMGMACRAPGSTRSPLGTPGRGGCPVGTREGMLMGTVPSSEEEGFEGRLKQLWDAGTWVKVSGAARLGRQASVRLWLAWFALTDHQSESCACPRGEDTREAGGGQGRAAQHPSATEMQGVLGCALCWGSLGGKWGRRGQAREGLSLWW